jgi:hypothetical protein
MAVPKAV